MSLRPLFKRNSPVVAMIHLGALPGTPASDRRLKHIEQQAHAVEFMHGDAVIVTGAVTGDAPKPEDVSAVKRATRLPVILGSGVTAGNVAAFMAEADGFIVGSEFKSGGRWSAGVSAQRVQRFMAAVAKAR